MLDKNTLVKVTNRDSGNVCYEIPDLGIRRVFVSGETKEVSAEEVRKLSYIPGGRYILENCLSVQEEELVSEVIGDVEPEYYYTPEDVERILLHGSLDEFLDCLDFAPKGVVEIIKNKAVDLRLNDISKRKAILEKTGFNVTKAIEIIDLANQKDEEEKDAAPKRRVAVTDKTENNEGGNARRTTAPKYKVVSTSK